ncbi:MAG: hypothetical protein V3U80_10685 [Flavobacteriaceae bacterium]
MKTATVTEIKKELKHQSQNELMALCLRLSKFKKENKELLTYLLFETDEADYRNAIKEDITLLFNDINTSSYYFIKKSVRKILRLTKKHIRYTQNKETEIELLLYFCEQLKDMKPSMTRNVSLQNIFDRQIILIKKSILKLHEDLQYDYSMELEELL